MRRDRWLGLDPRFITAAFALCLFLLIVTAKWATFDRFGSPMPDWDQWDAEALELFIPWFQNDHFLTHLVHPHNEHRVVLTKLQNLALVLCNGQWDCRLEALTNAMLHAGLGAGFWVWARRRVAQRWDAPLFLVTLALCGLPLAWQNILGGFHSQQYWLLGLSFLAIVTLPFNPVRSLAWWSGAIAAALALGSMGSGFLAAAVVMLVVVWRLAQRQIPLAAAVTTLAWSAAIVAFGMLTRVEVDWHQKLKAQTVRDFVLSIVHSLQWPLRDQNWAAAVMWLPWMLAAIGVVQSWRRRAAPAEPVAGFASGDVVVRHTAAGQAMVALGGWVLVQVIATAYARGAGADYPASRYMDTLAFGAMANAGALAWWMSSRSRDVRHTILRGAVVVAWVVTLLLGLREVTERNLRYELPDARKYYVKAEGHMRRYLATNDPKQLAHPDIPFPSAEGLIERLAVPSLRRLMPLPIRAPIEVKAAAESSPAFLRNDARGDDSENPPRIGISPATAPLDAAISWGSHGTDGVKTTGEWRSAPIAPGTFPWLKFEVAGDAGPPHNHAVSLALHDAATGAMLARILPSRRPRDTWRAAYVRAPRQRFVIVARDESVGGWVAFSPPVEMGGASYWAWQATKHSRLLLALSIFVTGALVVGTALIRRRAEARIAARPPAIVP